MSNCPNCGAVINDGETFCGNCGTPIVPASGVPAANAQANANYQQNYQQSNPGWAQAPYNSAPQYSQPVYGGVNQSVGVGDWFITLLLCAIPVVNIIMLCIWAFGSGTPESKSNFAKAQLIWLVISVVLSILVGIFFGLSVATLIGSYGY